MIAPFTNVVSRIDSRTKPTNKTETTNPSNSIGTKLLTVVKTNKDKTTEITLLNQSCLPDLRAVDISFTAKIDRIRLVKKKNKVCITVVF